MTILTKILAGTAGAAALATAAPVAAQYYSYSPRYANPYAYNAGVTNMAARQCQAAVQNRLSNRTTIGGILGAVLGARAVGGRVLNVTQVNPNRNTIRVRGLASSGRMAYNNWGPYGVGAYGALGYAQQPDLSFSCTVDYRGRVRDVDIDRRY